MNQDLQPHKLKIFLLDNDLFYLNISLKHLVNLGYSNVTSFQNESECLSNLAFQTPHVIFLDKNTLNMDNDLIIKRIKEYSPDTYIVMLSFKNSTSCINSISKQSVFDIIIKDQDGNEKINKILNRITEIYNTINRSYSYFFPNYKTG